MAIEIPEIPEGAPVFGDPNWIKVRESSVSVREVLEWYADDMEVSRHNKNAADWPCELCGDFVMEGLHYTRGYGNWVHRDCMAKALAFAAAVEKIQ